MMTVWGQGAVNVNTANAADALCARRARARRTAELCIDPTQMQLFIMGVTMAQGITMGAPLFGSPERLHQHDEGARACSGRC